MGPLMRELQAPRGYQGRKLVESGSWISGFDVWEDTLLFCWGSHKAEEKKVLGLLSIYPEPPPVL